jgi:hypothetical protein
LYRLQPFTSLARKAADRDTGQLNTLIDAQAVVNGLHPQYRELVLLGSM